MGELPEQALSLHRAWASWRAAPSSGERERAYRDEAAAYRRGHLLKPGEIVADRFQVLEHVGDGALTARWTGTDLHDDRPVLVEILHARFLGVPGLTDRFHAAAAAQQTCEVPGVLGVRDPGAEWEGFHWVATDRVGKALGASRADLDATGRLQVLLDVGEILQRTHPLGLFHGALDPDQVMIDPTRGAHISGFGMHPPFFTGSPHAAPETGDPSWAPAAAADRYSYAMMVAWMELGEIPYWALRTPERLAGEFPASEALQVALKASWALDPAQRPDDLGDILRALRGSTDSVRALAERAADHGRWDVAMGHYRQLLALTRGDADVRAELAICLARAGQTAQAIDQLQATLRTPGLKQEGRVLQELRALAIASDDPSAIPQLVGILEERAGVDGARVDLARLEIARLLDGPAAIDAWEKVMVAHTTRDQAAEALRELVPRTAAEGRWGAFVHWAGQHVEHSASHPDSEPVGRLCFRIGEACQQHLRDPNGALFWLQRARDEGYDHPDLHGMLEALQTERGDWADLLATYVARADEADGEAKAHALRRAARIARRAARQPDRAAELYRELLLVEADPEARLFLAELARREGDAAAERDHLEQLAPLDHDDLPATARVESGLRLGALQRNVGDPAAAEQLGRRLIAEFPGHLGVLQLMANLHRDAGRHQDAHPLLVQLSTTAPAPSELWSMSMLARSELMWRYGEIGESWALAEAVARQVPGHGGAAWALARCCLGSNPLREEHGTDLSFVPFTPQEALARLLDLLIDLDALQAYAASDPLGPAHAPQSLELAAAAVDRLLANHAVDDTLFTHLTELCPEQLDAIRMVERLWEPGPPVTSFPIARTYAWQRIPVSDDLEVQRPLHAHVPPPCLWEGRPDDVDLDLLLVASSRASVPEEGTDASIAPRVVSENPDLVLIAHPGDARQQQVAVASLASLTVGSGDDDTLKVGALGPAQLRGVRVANRTYLSGEGLTVRGRTLPEIRLREGLVFVVRDVPMRVVAATEAEELVGDDLTDFLDEVEDSEVMDRSEEAEPALFELLPDDEPLALVISREGEDYIQPLTDGRLHLPDDAQLETEEDGLRLTHGPLSRFLVTGETFDVAGVTYKVIRIQTTAPHPPPQEGVELRPALVLDDGSPLGKVLIVDGPKTIGRARDVDIQVRNDAKVSRRHATVEPRGPQVFLVDHGSSNGSYVNDERVEGERLLEPGDKLLIGDTAVEFRMWTDERDDTSEEVPSGADTLMGTAIRAAQTPISLREGRERMDVANRALGALLWALDQQEGSGAGRAQLQLLIDGSPRRFKPLFASVEVQRTGLPVLPVLLNVAGLSEPAQRAIFLGGLQDLVERSTQRFAELVDEPACEAMLEAVARTAYRRHLRV